MKKVNLLNINNHNLIETPGYVHAFTCDKCKIELFFNDDFEINFFYLNKKDLFPSNNLKHLTCEEIIIKKILE